MVFALSNRGDGDVFQNLFPARGRKPQKFLEGFAGGLLRFFRTYSPQGDGNAPRGARCYLVLSRCCFSEPIPRKGTETNLLD